ncbi:MAG: YbaK/EbsC family protein [Gammaproteobacteria bacterium]
MAISSTLSKFLDQQKVAFDLIPHPHTSNSMDTARKAQVPGNRLAKAVVVKEDGNYSMVIVPSVEQVDLVLLREQIGHGVKLATEYELGELFPDCAIGAVPPVGAAWGLDTYLDECFLRDDEEVFFEAGDHEDLVRVTGDQFQKLLGNVRPGRYGHTI